MKYFNFKKLNTNLISCKYSAYKLFLFQIFGMTLQQMLNTCDVSITTKILRQISIINDVVETPIVEQCIKWDKKLNKNLIYRYYHPFLDHKFEHVWTLKSQTDPKIQAWRSFGTNVCTRIQYRQSVFFRFDWFGQLEYTRFYTKIVINQWYQFIFPWNIRLEIIDAKNDVINVFGKLKKNRWTLANDLLLRF